jgi:hypothetical protein
MARDDARSLNDIRRETERARADLLKTAGELRKSVVETSQDFRERVKPASIKAEMTGYVRSRAGEMLNDAAQAASRNPLQAAVVFGSLAYPLFRITKAIPVPVWLIGAGLYLARSETVAQGTAALADKVGDASAKAMSGVKDGIDSASEQLDQARDRARSAVGSGSRQAGDLATSASASLQETSEKLTGAAADMAASTSEAASGVAERLTSLGQDAVQSARRSWDDASRAASETASSVKDQTAGTFLRAVEDNPLLVAGVGLLIGAVIAGALPRTDVEDELMRAPSRSAKRLAQSAADRGVSAASDAARDGIRRAAEQADAEGLDTEGLDEAARDLGHRVRRVAEAAVTTAFEPPEDNEQANADGGRNNG